MIHVIDATVTRRVEYIDERLLEGYLAENDIRHARVGCIDAEELAHCRTTEVEIDEHHAFPGARERHGEVGDGGGLPFLLESTCNEDGTSTPVKVDEVEVGAEHTERLRLMAAGI